MEIIAIFIGLIIALWISNAGSGGSGGNAESRSYDRMYADDRSMVIRHIFIEECSGGMGRYALADLYNELTRGAPHDETEDEFRDRCLALKEEKYGIKF